MKKLTIGLTIIILASGCSSTETPNKLGNTNVSGQTTTSPAVTHWTSKLIDDLKTKEFPDKIKNTWLTYIRAIDGTIFVNLRYEFKDNNNYNYYDRLYSENGIELVKPSGTGQITPLNAKRAYVDRTQEWDLIEKKILSPAQFNKIIVKQRSVPRILKAEEQAFKPEEILIEEVIGIVETTNPKNVYGSKLQTGYALDTNLNVINKIGPVREFVYHHNFVSVTSTNGSEKPYNWDLTPQGSEKVVAFNNYKQELNMKNKQREEDFKKDQERIASEAKTEIELKKSNEACFELAKSTRNLPMAYKCGENLGDKYGNWLLEEPEADVEVIGAASKQHTKMHYLILHKLSERYKILKGLGHQNMKALKNAQLDDEARRKRDAVSAATAQSTSNNGSPVDYNKSYKEIQWQQGVNNGGPTWDQINSNGK